MGSFNRKGFISNIPICYSDEIVAFICVYNGFNNAIIPLGPPIEGLYDDYGSIDSFDKTESVLSIERFFEEPIDVIIDKIERHEGRNDDICGSIKFYLEKVLKKINKINFMSYYHKFKDINLYLLLEHKSVYHKVYENYDRSRNNEFTPSIDKILQNKQIHYGESQIKLDSTIIELFYENNEHRIKDKDNLVKYQCFIKAMELNSFAFAQSLYSNQDPDTTFYLSLNKCVNTILSNRDIEDN